MRLSPEGGEKALRLPLPTSQPLGLQEKVLGPAAGVRLRPFGDSVFSSSCYFLWWGGCLRKRSLVTESESGCG